MGRHHSLIFLSFVLIRIQSIFCSSYSVCSSLGTGDSGFAFFRNSSLATPLDASTSIEEDSDELRLCLCSVLAIHGFWASLAQLPAIMIQRFQLLLVAMMLLTFTAAWPWPPSVEKIEGLIFRRQNNSNNDKSILPFKILTAEFLLRALRLNRNVLISAHEDPGRSVHHILCCSLSDHRYGICIYIRLSSFISYGI